MQWHPKKVIDDILPYPIILDETIMGCGLYQCVNLVHSLKRCTTLTKHEKVINLIKDYCIETGVGAVIVSCGEDWYSTIPKLKRLGFIELSEYHNYRHGDNYQQKLFILKIKKES